MKRIAHRIRTMAVVWAAPTCCGQPMMWTNALPNGWICQKNPTHVQ